MREKYESCIQNARFFQHSDPIIFHKHFGAWSRSNFVKNHFDVSASLIENLVLIYIYNAFHASQMNYRGIMSGSR